MGERLSRWALHHEYGRDEIVSSGPSFREMSIKEGKVRIHFDSIGGGLRLPGNPGVPLPSRHRETS